MRSRIIWTIVVSGVVLIGIGLMHFSLTALQEPGPLETRIANLAKHSVIRLASRHGIPPMPVDTRASVDAGGTHVPQISLVSECRTTLTRSCFGSSRTASDSQECQPSARWSQRITFGVW